MTLSVGRRLEFGVHNGPFGRLIQTMAQPALNADDLHRSAWKHLDVNRHYAFNMLRPGLLGVVRLWLGDDFGRLLRGPCGCQSGVSQRRRRRGLAKINWPG